MSQFFYFNIASEAWGLLLCITCTICAVMLNVDDRRMMMSFAHLFMAEGFVLLSDIAGLIFDGSSHTALVILSNTLLFEFSFLLLTVFTDYVVDLTGVKTGWVYRWKYVVRVLCYAEMLITLVNIFFPIYFYVDAANVYHRHTFFWLSQAMAILVAIMNEVVVIVCRKRLSRIRFWSVTAYSIMPSVAMAVQIFLYGISILNITTTLLLLVCFLAMMGETNRTIYAQRESIAKQESELAENRAKIMLSQMQPHFLYNALNSIYYLCGKDPKLAQKAVGDFADYLRMNLDSLKTKENIPFAMELKHIQTYLWLEQLRFDERLNVVYDIQCRDFLLPVLSIQPLVENAVKHGICSRPEGGTVTLSTREREDCFEIIVSDDGIGFDPSVKKNDGRSHIGLQNCIQRVRMEIRGDVEVKSIPGVGTTITVRIPKGEN